MPTGYTAPVQSGKTTTLRQFALECSRAFGALITLKDDMDKPIPQQFTPDTKYYDEQIAASQELLVKLPKLSLKECDARAEEKFLAAMQGYNERAVEKSLEKQRYEEMLFRAERWIVPEDLQTLKEFMIEQLRESLRFDCGGNYNPEPPVRLTGERWREKELERVSRDFSYYTVEREKEAQRVAGRNAWLQQLWKALPPEE